MALTVGGVARIASLLKDAKLSEGAGGQAAEALLHVLDDLHSIVSTDAQEEVGVPDLDFVGLPFALPTIEALGRVFRTASADLAQECALHFLIAPRLRRESKNRTRTVETRASFLWPESSLGGVRGLMELL